MACYRDSFTFFIYNIFQLHQKQIRFLERNMIFKFNFKYFSNALFKLNKCDNLVLATELHDFSVTELNKRNACFDTPYRC
jgi:hypothetical protein